MITEMKQDIVLQEQNNNWTYCQVWTEKEIICGRNVHCQNKVITKNQT